MEMTLLTLFLLFAPQPSPNPAFAPVNGKPGLPRVLLIGDSISIGYTLPVRELLKGKANLHRIPENAAHTDNGVKKLDGWLGNSKWDVIHFNFGLHDLKIMEDGKHQVSLEQYEANLRTIVARLEKTGARLIWTATTPVPAGKLTPPRKSEDVALFNAAARRVMEEAGLAIDDLYAFAMPRSKEIQRPENVHFTEEGSRVLAGAVAESILAALERAPR
jgi:lysophospholipase L1-like esterase